MVNKKNGKKKFSPIFILVLLTFIIMIASFIFSSLGIDGNRTIINNKTLETSLVVVDNIFSIEGLQYILNNITKNFSILEPLALLIVSVLGISIGVTSGFLEAVFKPFKKTNLSIIIFFTMIIGIFASLIGTDSYIIFIPLIAAFYHYAGRSPAAGVIIMFLSISIGYGVNLLPAYDDYSLSLFTELSATVDIDKTFEYSLMSTQIFMFISVIVLIIAGTIIFRKTIAEKFTKKYKFENDTKVSKKGVLYSGIAFIVLVGLVAYSIIPDLTFPASGSLLDFNSDVYVEMLLGENSPFKNGIVIIFASIIAVCSFIYGVVSKNVKDNKEYTLGISNSFKDIGYLFVLMFFISLITTVLEYTNLSVVISSILIDFISTIPMTGIPLIIISMFIIILIGIMIPNILTKWEIISPILVPLFMRANMTPEFIQIIFRVSDGIAKTLSPFFIYFIIMIGFLQKYDKDNENVTIFGTIKLMFPAIIMMMVVWILIIIGFYIVGLPLGSVNATL